MRARFVGLELSDLLADSVCCVPAASGAHCSLLLMSSAAGVGELSGVLRDRRRGLLEEPLSTSAAAMPCSAGALSVNVSVLARFGLTEAGISASVLLSFVPSLLLSLLRVPYLGPPFGVLPLCCTLRDRVERPVGL